MKETQAPRQQSECNCKIPQNCPVKNKCLTESVIYKATVKQPTGGQCEYIGLTDNAFKTRYNLHNHTFRNESKKSATSLATYVWNKGTNQSPSIEWQILKQCQRYAPGQKTCQLCLWEKVFIVKNLNSPNSLNKRTDIGNKCVLHRKKHYLDHVTWINTGDRGRHWPLSARGLDPVSGRGGRGNHQLTD